MENPKEYNEYRAFLRTHESGNAVDRRLDKFFAGDEQEVKNYNWWFARRTGEEPLVVPIASSLPLDTDELKQRPTQAWDATLFKVAELHFRFKREPCLLSTLIEHVTHRNDKAQIAGWSHKATDFLRDCGWLRKTVKYDGIFRPCWFPPTLPQVQKVEQGVSLLDLAEMAGLSYSTFYGRVRKAGGINKLPTAIQPFRDYGVYRWHKKQVETLLLYLTPKSPGELLTKVSKQKLTDFAEHLREKGLSASTITVYCGVLRRGGSANSSIESTVKRAWARWLSSRTGCEKPVKVKASDGFNKQRFLVVLAEHRTQPCRMSDLISYALCTPKATGSQISMWSIPATAVLRSLGWVKQKGCNGRRWYAPASTIEEPIAEQSDPIAPIDDVANVTEAEMAKILGCAVKTIRRRLPTLPDVALPVKIGGLNRVRRAWRRSQIPALVAAFSPHEVEKETTPVRTAPTPTSTSLDLLNEQVKAHEKRLGRELTILEITEVAKLQMLLGATNG